MDYRKNVPALRVFVRDWDRALMIVFICRDAYCCTCMMQTRGLLKILLWRRELSIYQFQTFTDGFPLVCDVCICMGVYVRVISSAIELHTVPEITINVLFRAYERNLRRKNGRASWRTRKIISIISQYVKSIR